MTQPENIWIEHADVVDKVSITYYPINADFSVKSPEIVFTDFKALITKLPGKTIFVQKIGFPSSTTLNSGDDKQAEFFCNFFMFGMDIKTKLLMLVFFGSMMFQ